MLDWPLGPSQTGPSFNLRNLTRTLTLFFFEWGLVSFIAGYFFGWPVDRALAGGFALVFLGNLYARFNRAPTPNYEGFESWL